MFFKLAKLPMQILWPTIGNGFLYLISGRSPGAKKRDEAIYQAYKEYGRYSKEIDEMKDQMEYCIARPDPKVHPQNIEVFLFIIR